MPTIAARVLALLVPLILVSALVDKPARADEVLLTFGDMVRLQRLPLDSTTRALSEEELILYQNFEFYAYTVFESLQVANSAARLIDQKPLFCAPEETFHFSQDGDIARLADYVTGELFALTEEIGGPPNRYDDKPASLVLLLGLRAAFPCDEQESVLAQR
jgi:hypothetical protein